MIFLDPFVVIFKQTSSGDLWLFPTFYGGFSHLLYNFRCAYSDFWLYIAISDFFIAISDSYKAISDSYNTISDSYNAISDS